MIRGEWNESARGARQRTRSKKKIMQKSWAIGNWKNCESTILQAVWKEEEE